MRQIDWDGPAEWATHRVACALPNTLLRDPGGKSYSRVLLHVYLAELVEAGCYLRCQLGAKGLLCDNLLAALADHARFCVAAGTCRTNLFH